MINTDRLADLFMRLVQIDSESKREGKICEALQDLLRSMGAEIHVDEAGQKVGSDSGNLIARFKGNRDVPAMMLNAHMDTVKPGKGVIPHLKDGVFTSEGDTILGSDDKSGVAILLEVVQTIVEKDLPHGPIEVVFTICEEVGLLGAKNLDVTRLSSTFGYALDSRDTEGIVTRAPGANRMEIIVHGKEAHAGAEPEKGINAISVAGKAIAALEIGRIDRETTCNIGVIEGGTATNIVPNRVTIKGEVRSHDPDKLNRVTDGITAAFQSAVDAFKKSGQDELPRLEIDLKRDFSRTHIPEDHPVVVLAQEASRNLGRTLTCKTTGGGADANIFFEKGIMTGVLGTGMRDVHTSRENIALADMVKTAELVMEIIRLHGEHYLDKFSSDR